MATHEVTPEKDARWALKCAQEAAEKHWREWDRLSELALEAQENAIREMNRGNAARRKLKEMGCWP